MKIEVGKQYWLIDGTKVEVVSTNPLIVYEIVEVEAYDGCYETSGRMRSCSKKDIFEEPPTAVLNREVAELQKQIDELRKKAREAQREFNEQEKERQEKLEKLAASNEALANIEEIINGDCMYFVCRRYGDYKILNVNDMLDNIREYRTSGGKYCLMTLYLYKNYDGLKWRIYAEKKTNASYGSYLDENDVIPCATLEEAKQTLQNILHEKIKSGNASQSILDNLNEYGLEVPIGYEKQIQDEKAKSIRQSIESRQNEIDQMYERLKELYE